MVDKICMSVREASKYSGIGVNKLYALTKEPDCPFVLWIGTKRLIKKAQFDEFIKNAYSV